MPSLGRVLLSMQIARVAQSMIQVAMVLFAFQRYDSPTLAGACTFAAVVPGLVVSPIAGALLDRHGRVRLVILDFAVASTSMIIIAALSLAGELPPWLLILITAVSGLTAPLSSAGLRSLFPLLVPRPLWERVNALDSNGWALASILGAPVAAVATQYIGFEPTFCVIAAGYGAAAVMLIGAPDPRTEVISTGKLLVDAWQGLVYTWRNPTLRGLAISLSTMNLSYGMMEIFLPAIVLYGLGEGQSVVGWLYGIMAVAGVISAFAAGRIRSEGRERLMIALPTFAMVGAFALFLVPGSVVPLAVAMAAFGFLNGPVDIGLFTLRQRVTDPSWMGRAFTVSMNLNFSGMPIGAALAGVIVLSPGPGVSDSAASASTAIAAALATVVILLSAILTVWLVPAPKGAATAASEPNENPAERERVLPEPRG